MNTQVRNSGGGARHQKKFSNTNSGGGGGADSVSQTTTKKTDSTKPEKEKVQPKPTAEQLRIAQITNSNASEDPQMREKVATLIEMTQRSEEEVCCALYECDNNLESAVVFLLETLPVGAFETSSKKKKPKAANAGQDGSGDGDWVDANANSDRRDKSRNRSSNRGGRGGTDSRGWRGREARENERNLRESRGGERSDRGGGGGGGDNERFGDNYRRGPRGTGEGGRRGGDRGERGDRGNGYVSRSGRGGGRIGGRGPGGRGERGGGSYNSRFNTNDEHQEVELWDNAIAQNAEKQQDQTQDDAWGDWDNEEYVGSLKDSKVFTTSNLPNQTVASVVSGNLGPSELSAPPGLEHHISSSVLQQQGSHLSALVGTTSSGLVDDGSNATGIPVTPPAVTTPMMQYSAAVSSTQLQPQQSNVVGVGSAASLSSQYNSAADTFSNAATAAANLVQQVQQQQQQAQLKTSATLSAEQSQYFNSLTSQNTGASTGVPQQQMPTYAQNAAAPYPTTYANVFGTGATGSGAGNVVGDQTQLSNVQQPQVRRPRAKVPPPSKIPSTAVEMPGDTLNNIGYLDVQFGGLDFGTDDSFDALSDKFTNSVNIDNQQQQLVQSQDVSNEYQNKSSVQQQQAALAASLQNQQMGESLSSGFTARNAAQQQQVVSNVSGGGNNSSLGSNSNALDQLAKNDPYNQSSASNSTGYQSSYQTSGSAKTANAYQQSTTGQGYTNSSYVNVQSSVANSYQPQSYGAYQQNSVNAYQQQQTSSVQNVANSVAGNNVSSTGGATQNIPGGSGNNGASANTNAGYMSSGYPSQPNAYQTSQSVYGNTGLSNNTGVPSSSTVSSSSSGTAVSSATSAANSGSATNTNNVNNNVNNGSVVAAVASSSSVNNGGNNQGASSVVAASASVSSTANKSGSGAGGMVPNIQMVSQYIQTGMPYYQQPVYSYEDLQMMQQRVPHVQGYYDLNYTPTSLGTARDNLGSVAYSTMTDGRFARTDNNSSPVSNVSSTMSQQAGSAGGPMLNVPYAYFYGGNVMPGSFQYGTPAAIYPQQLPAANTASGGQYPKPSYNTGYGSTGYDTITQASQDYTKGAYPSSVNQQTKSQNVSNPPAAVTGSDISSSMYSKGHVALNKVNSYEKQNFHSGTPPPFTMPNTQTAGGTSQQPYGMYLPMPAATGHHNIMHQPIHQMDGRIHSSSRRDSNSTGQRQQTSNQSKSSTKQGYSPSYWPGQN